MVTTRPLVLCGSGGLVVVENDYCVCTNDFVHALV